MRKVLLLALTLFTNWHAHAEAPTIALVKPVDGNLKFSDELLVNWDGASTSLADTIDSRDITVVSFAFSGCSTICPLSLAAMQALASKTSGYNLVTLAVDPFNDQPATFAEFAGAFSPGANWSWLTGDPRAVFASLEGLSYRFGELNAHPPVFLIINHKSGKYLKVSSEIDGEKLISLVELIASGK
jgi:protein SCO1